MITKQKIIAAVVILCAFLFSKIFFYWILWLWVPLFFLCVTVVLCYINNYWRGNSYNTKHIIVNLLSANQYEIFMRFCVTLKVFFCRLCFFCYNDKDGSLRQKYLYFIKGFLNYKDIFRKIIVINIVLSILSGLKISAEISQNFFGKREASANVIDAIQSPTIALIPSLEFSAYSLTTTLDHFRILTPTPPLKFTPTLTFTPASTSTPTSIATPIPTLTAMPTRRVVFGPSLLFSERRVILTPTPSYFLLSEREKNALPSIVILEFTVSEDNFHPKLLLANFGHTIGMADWELYFNQHLICTFGEYIFWPDTTLVLDMSKNIDERTIDDQLILTCKQINKNFFSGSVTIGLQDHTDTEIDRYVYEK